jgi:hypothetical protein
MRSTLLFAALLAGSAAIPALAQERASSPVFVQPADDAASPHARRRWNAAQDDEHHARRRWNAAHDDDHHARRRWNAANPPEPEVRPHRPELTRPMVQRMGSANQGGRGR